MLSYNTNLSQLDRHLRQLCLIRIVPLNGHLHWGSKQTHQLLKMGNEYASTCGQCHDFLVTILGPAHKGHIDPSMSRKNIQLRGPYYTDGTGSHALQKSIENIDSICSRCLLFLLCPEGIASTLCLQFPRSDHGRMDTKQQQCPFNTQELKCKGTKKAGVDYGEEVHRSAKNFNPRQGYSRRRLV